MDNVNKKVLEDLHRDIDCLYESCDTHQLYNLYFCCADKLLFLTHQLQFDLLTE